MAASFVLLPFSFILLLFTAFATLSYLFFWYEAANSPYRAYLDTISQGRTRQWIIRGIAYAVVSMFLVVLFTPLSWCRALWRTRPDHDCPLPPIVLIHGLYHNVSAWTLYRRWLKRSGFTNVYYFGHNCWKNSFNELLDQLNTLVLDVQRTFPGKGIILIGHSLGGLLGRAFVETKAEEGTIAALVTLGSPHQGSKMAVLSLTPWSEHLRYRGPFIEELEQKCRPTNVPRLAIYSPIDSMVLPVEALRSPDSGWEHIECKPVSHVSMLFHKRTALLAIKHIRKVC